MSLKGMSDQTSRAKSTAEELKKLKVKGTVTLHVSACWISGRRVLRGFPLLACLL